MTRRTRGPAQKRPQLALLGGFRLIVDGAPVALPIHAQRVLAYLSLVQPTQPAHLRAGLAERLWSDVPVERSQASLRTALWRIRQAGQALVESTRETVRLGGAVEVDVRHSVAQAGRLLAEDSDVQPSDADPTTLRGDLLPGWDEDWLLLERERLRQIQIHALEALARRLLRLGRHMEAIDAAYCAVAAEPLREPAHVVLIDVFLAEGDVAAARQQFERYSSLLASELGIRPSATLTDRVFPRAGTRPTLSLTIAPGTAAAAYR